MKDLILSSKKAIVPLVVGGILVALGAIGITGQMTVEEALTLAVTAALVWLVPNKNRTKS